MAWASIPGAWTLHCSIEIIRYYPIHFITGMPAPTVSWSAAFQCMPRPEIFSNTGIQFMQINTLYQLFAMAQQKSPLFDVAKSFVMIPDLFNFWLSGEITNEFTDATTSQCLDPRTRTLGNAGAGGAEHPGASFPAGHRARHLDWDASPAGCRGDRRGRRSGSLSPPATIPALPWRPSRPGTRILPGSAREPGPSWARKSASRP